MASDVILVGAAVGDSPDAVFTVSVSFDLDAERARAKFPAGCLARVARTGRVVRVATLGNRFPGQAGLFFSVVHEAGSTPTAYWLHEIEPVELLTFAHALGKVGLYRQSFTRVMPDDPEGVFKEFRAMGWDDLSTRSVGNEHDLALAYANARFAVETLRRGAEALETSTSTNRRPEPANVAGLLVVAAGQLVNSAILPHLRQSPWEERASLVVLRTALETLAASAAIATGPASVRETWEAGHKVGGWSDLLALARIKNGAVDMPQTVYGWLSKHTHFLPEVVTKPPRHADAYATIAYVGWLCAVMAECILGYTDIATWPQRWPDPLPWRSEAPSAVGSPVER